VCTVRITAPHAVIDLQFEYARRFFALPLGEKMALHTKKSASAAGDEPIGGHILGDADSIL